MLEIAIQLNDPFIRDALKEFQDIRVVSLKNDSLMGNFMILQALSNVEVSYQDIQMVSTYLDQNIPLMEEYDLLTCHILVVSYPNSLEFLEVILSLDESILQVINIWLHPPKEIFYGSTQSILGLNPPKFSSILCMFLNLIKNIWKRAYRFKLSLYEDAFEPFATQTCH